MPYNTSAVLPFIGCSQVIKTKEYRDFNNSFEVLIPTNWEIDNPISNKRIVLKCIDRATDGSIKMFNIQINAVPNATTKIDLSMINEDAPGISQIVSKRVIEKGMYSILLIETIDIMGNHSLMHLVPRNDEMFILNFFVPNDQWAQYKELAEKCLNSFTFI